MWAAWSPGGMGVKLGRKDRDRDSKRDTETQGASGRRGAAGGPSSLLRGSLDPRTWARAGRDLGEGSGPAACHGPRGQSAGAVQPHPWGPHGATCSFPTVGLGEPRDAWGALGWGPGGSHLGASQTASGQWPQSVAGGPGPPPPAPWLAQAPVSLETSVAVALALV